MAAQYRALQDLYPGIFIAAGTIFSDSAPDFSVPVGWVPPAAVDPISPEAIQNFWNAGPQFVGLIRQQWTNTGGIGPPAIYWQPYPAGGGTRPMILTGAGAALGFTNWTNTRGSAP
jgi:hypothetical protein